MIQKEQQITRVSRRRDRHGLGDHVHFSMLIAGYRAVHKGWRWAWIHDRISAKSVRKRESDYFFSRTAALPFAAFFQAGGSFPISTIKPRISNKRD